MINQLQQGAGARRRAPAGGVRRRSGGGPMKISDVSVDRPVLISMIMVALILLGAIALPMLPVAL